MLQKIRAIAKILLKGTWIFKFSKTLYISLKMILDKKKFEKKYPEATYIQYSIADIQRQRKDGYCSQYGQDFFLWSKFFRHINDGFFIEIGANDPIQNSNSYFFEQQGWRGVGIDPISRFDGLWKDNRSSQFFCGAVADKEMQINFVEILPKEGWEHALSGFKENVRPEDLNIYDYIEYPVLAKPLSSYLTDIPQVNLIMIDVEGAEIQVLQGIDFDHLKPDFVMIENISEYGGNDYIREYMKNYGYHCIARIAATDDVFCKEV